MMSDKRFMYRKVLFLCISSLLIFSGCNSHKKSTNTASKSKYERAPIVEVSEQRLQLDAQSIDAKLQKELGFRDKAMALYLDILKKDSNYTIAWFDLGELYFMKGDFEKAIQSTKKAIELAPENVWYRMQLAEIYRNTFRLRDAAKEYEQVVKIYPDELPYYYEWATALLLAGDGEGAIRVYNLIEKKIGANEALSEQKQAVWKSLGRTDKVIEEVEKLWKQNPNEVKYNAILAELYMGQKDYSKALKYYEKVKELDPNNQYINIAMAEYYKAVNQPQKAFEALKDAFLSNNMQVDSKLQILVSFYTIDEFYGKYKDYTSELVTIIHQQDSNNIRLQPIYGDMMLRSGNYNEALNAFQKMLARDSSQYEVFEAVLVSASYVNDTSVLFSASEKAMHLFPTQPLPYYYNGLAYFENKDYQKAEEVLQKGVRWVISNNDILIGFNSILAECYHQMGDNEKSDQYFNKSLELDPENEMLLNNYAYYLSVRKVDLKKAEEMSKKTLQKKPDNTTYLDTYAWIMFQMGNYHEALTLMEQVIKLTEDPDSVILEHYADILYKNDKIEEARIYWGKALEKGEGSDKLEEKAGKGVWVE